MANPTTNYGFVLPTATDLVTDLPADFDVALQGVDTRLKALQPGTTLGDIAYSSATANTNTRLGIGTTGQVLTVVAGVPAWSSEAGDISAVTAGTGITGGGTSGAVTVSFDQANFGGGQFAAGKNKIINGDFNINQRAFTSTTTDSTYGFDRWRLDNNGGATFTAQVFTPGTAPVAGYESKNYLRCVTTGQSGAAVYTLFRQTIEDVRTYAGQTVTLSFWAKANTGTPKIASDIRQSFGSGGSPSATVNTYGGQATLSTSWARYSLTVAIPSISGKTIGTTADTSAFILQFWISAGTDYDARTGSLGIQSNTFEFWGLQIEAGSTATPFQTATGTLQGELAACQRYYWRWATGNDLSLGIATFYSTTNAALTAQFPVTMRTTPTLDAASGTTYYSILNTSCGFDSLTISRAHSNGCQLLSSTLGAVQTLGSSSRVRTNDASTYVAFSAEL